MCADYVDLRKKYAEIRSLCVAKLEFYRTYTDMGILAKIIDVYGTLLIEYEKFCLKRIDCKDGDWQEDDIYARQTFGIGSEIIKAYHSVWMEEAYEKEDVYFLSRERTKFLNWKREENPYKNLKQLDYGYGKKVAGRGRDVVNLFEEMTKLLGQDLPVDDFVCKADKCLRRCFLFLFGTQKESVL